MDAVGKLKIVDENKLSLFAFTDKYLIFLYEDLIYLVKGEDDEKTVSFFKVSLYDGLESNYELINSKQGLFRIKRYLNCTDEDVFLNDNYKPKLIKALLDDGFVCGLYEKEYRKFKKDKKALVEKIQKLNEEVEDLMVQASLLEVEFYK